MFSRLFLLALLPAALAVPLTLRDCVEPTTFEIDDFQNFSPDEGNTVSNATLIFRFADTATNVSTSCDRTSSTGFTSWAKCDDAPVHYSFDGTTLSLREKIDCGETLINGTSTKTITGSIKLDLDCYPESFPFPLGDGTLCETGTGSADGQFNK